MFTLHYTEVSFRGKYRKDDTGKLLGLVAKAAKIDVITITFDGPIWFRVNLYF